MFLDTKSLFAARTHQPKVKARDRRRRPAIESLEERKVLSTMTGGSGSGNFEGMAWVYNYDQAQKSGTLTITDQPGQHTIHITAMHPNLSEGDPGYDPNHVNDITGIQLTDNDQGGGPNVVVGTHVNIVVRRNAGDNTFVDNEPSFAFSTTPRAVTTPPVAVPPAVQSGTADGLGWAYSYNATGKVWNLTVFDKAGTDTLDLRAANGKLNFVRGSTTFAGPTLATDAGATGSITAYRDAHDIVLTNHSGYAMTALARTSTTLGSAFGLNYRYTYDASSKVGILRVQDAPGANQPAVYVQKVGNTVQFYHATVTSAPNPGRPSWFPANLWPSHTVITPTQYAAPLTLTAGASVKLEIFRNTGDVSVTDVASSSNDFSVVQTLARTTSATMGTPNGPIALTYDYDSIANSGTLTITSRPGSGLIDINNVLQSPDPGEPADSPTADPIQSIDLVLRGTDGYSGGLDIFHPGEADPTVSLVIKRRAGDYTFQNNTGFALSTASR